MNQPYAKNSVSPPPAGENVALSTAQTVSSPSQNASQEQRKNNHSAAAGRGNLAARIVLPCLCAMVASLIFFSSSRSGAVSGAWSQNATTWLHTELPGGASLFAGITEPLLRKLGHLGEFALLGITLLCCLRAYTPHLLRACAWPMLAGLLVAVADECFQLMVPGREGRVTDVLIDFAGLLLGIGLCAAVLALIKAAKRARKKGRR